MEAFNERKKEAVCQLNHIIVVLQFLPHWILHKSYSHLHICNTHYLTNKKKCNNFVFLFSGTWESFRCLWNCFFASWKGEKGGFCEMNYSKYRKITVFPNFNLKHMTTDHLTLLMLQSDACQLCLEAISLPALYYSEDLGMQSNCSFISEDWGVGKQLLIYFIQY